MLWIWENPFYKKIKTHPLMTNPIPADWKQVKLGEIAKFSQGVQVDLELQKKEKTEGFVSFLRIENYTQNSQDFRYIKDDKWVAERKLHKKDIVVVRYGASAGFIGRGYEGVLANNLFQVSPRDSVDIDYLYKVLKRPATYKFFQAEMFGGAMPALSFKIVEKLKLLLPPLPEQHRIVTVIETWDKVLEKLNRKIEFKKNIKKGLMQKLLQGESRLTGFDEEWQIVELGNVINEKSKTARSSGDGLERGEFPFFVNNTSAYSKFLNEFDFDGEFIIANTGGRAYFDYYNGKFASMADCHVFNSEKVDIKFLFLKIKQIENLIDHVGFFGSGINHLDKKWFRKLELKIPKSKEEQIAIAQILTIADNEITTLEKKKQILEDQKKYLLNNLITGQIRTPENLTITN
jgi:type I restriction enzyme, S subunit